MQYEFYYLKLECKERYRFCRIYSTLKRGDFAMLIREILPLLVCLSSGKLALTEYHRVSYKLGGSF
jgi:hypothetical protein